jgi:predicted DNA-binding transcriptional regulator YafY
VTAPVDGPEQTGYRIDPDSFYLPDLGLSADEQAALHLAVAGVHLGDPSGRDALLKLGATGLTEARPLASLAPPEALVPLFDALRSRALVTFTYRGAERHVAPGGLWFRRGHWYLAGWDQDRGAARTFRVDRMGDRPTRGADQSGVVPAAFDASTAVPAEPWRTGEDDEQEVQVLVDPTEAPRVTEELGERAVTTRWPDGSVLLRLDVTSVAALRSWVLGLLDHAVVLSPATVREAVVAWLRAIAAPATEADSAEGVLPIARLGGAGDPSAPNGAPDEAPPGGRDASARLRRLLAMMGWLARVGEASIEELAARFGLSAADVVHELELAACCGLPPYSPDMLMEIVVTDETVQARLPEDLARPRRLTPAEGFALAATARTILAVPGADDEGALARAVDKLDAALGGHQALVVDLDDPRLLSEVRRAVDDSAQLEIEYHSASADETTRRVVDPLSIIALDGHWYLDGWCHRAGGLRRFRVDRIRTAQVTGERVPDAARAAGVVDDAFVAGPGAVRVVLAVDAGAAWVADSIPVVSSTSTPDGGQLLTLAVGGRAWLERLLLQLGPGARLVDPPELTGVAAAAADRVLLRYQLT